MSDRTYLPPHRPYRAASVQSVVGVMICLALTSVVRGDEPLHVRIDRLLDAARTGPAPLPADDAAFLRRVHLDLWGMVPTADEVRAFLEDASPDKRVQAVDRLLNDARYVRRVTLFLDRMLMERRRHPNIKEAEWLAWLHAQAENNRPLNELVGAILAADGTDESNRAAAAFLIDRENEPHLWTRDVGRIFLGVDLQCAQCHDHPVIDDYYQQDYYGLNAFLNRSSLFTDSKTKQVSLGETAEGDTTFTSVFIDGEKYSAAPHLPGETPIDEPTFPKGEEYLVKPAKDVRAVPKHSRRAALAELLSSGKSRQFARNLANRLWALMMGRGLVDPVDLHHNANPPSHPQLLELLTDELTAMRFDMRTFLREIALSGVYQQSHRMPDGLLELASAAGQFLADAQSQAAQAQTAIDALSTASLALREQTAAAEAALKPLDDEMSQAQAALAKAEKHLAEANQALEAATNEATAKADAEKSVQQLAANAAQVAAKLPEDQVVKEAAEKLKSRAAQLAAEVAQARQQADQLTAKAQQAAEDVAKTRADVERLTAARKQADDRRVQLDREQNVNDQQERDARHELVAAQARLRDVELLGEHCRAAAETPDSEAAAAAWTMLLQRWSERAFIARLRPLEPEQFALSTLQATGVLPSRRADAIKAQQAKNPQDPQSWAFSQEIEQSVYNQTQKDVAAFVSILSHGHGPDAHGYEATVDEALFLANGSQVRGWLAPRPGSLSERLQPLTDPAEAADELYLNVLSRRPEPQETAAVAEFLQGRSDAERAAAIQEMIWGLLTSTEFRFNH